MRESRDDDASGGGEGSTADDVPPGFENITNCRACDAPIVRGEWHYLDTKRDADGSTTVLAFCSVACRDAWQGGD